LDIERGQCASGKPCLWQTDTILSKNSWGYIQNQEYKPVACFIHDLIDIVSKNGVLLLNIGPKPDGTIPDEELRMLGIIGQWLDLNGEAIFKTEPWKTFGEGPTVVPEGGFTDCERAQFTFEDFRFTVGNGFLYVHMLGWTQGSSLVRSLGKSEGIDLEQDPKFFTLLFGQQLGGTILQLIE